ncbi:MAG: ATP-dependent DNA helicase RecG [Alphaproteobacteria bacterium]|nr:ATP-dependent DNA helicase RecG [Alphaproteobacteria bacterium]
MRSSQAAQKIDQEFNARSEVEVDSKFDRGFGTESKEMFWSSNRILLLPIRQFIQLSPYTYKLLKKCCGGDRLVDILLHFPSGLSKRTSDEDYFKDGEKLTVVLTVLKHVVPRYKNSPYRIIGQTDLGNFVTIMYFHYRTPYLRRILPIGGTFTVSGNASRELDGIKIIHPDIVAPPHQAKYYVGAEPIYPLVGNLSLKTLRYVISSALKLISKLIPKNSDWIPNDLRDKYGLADFADALQAVHCPKSEEDLLITNEFRKRIAIDELLANQIRLKQIKKNQQERKSVVLKPTGEIFQKLKLPFELTEDQMKCFEDIKTDLASGTPMNRLIQGDVGSGKTITAFLGMLIALENKLQAVFLAPTEILAWQHFETIQKLSENLNLEIDIMLSSNRKARKRQIRDLQDGTTQILIGTHAILEDNIEFRNLGFIVIDEQHKFGVMQRLKLINKSRYPNILSMSATPIPRTLLLGCYGDIDVSTIKTKPKGRQTVETAVIGTNKIESLVERLKTTDSQIFWVCPVIEESESLVDVNTRCEYLKKAFSGKEVEVLHGKMKSYEKDEIMTRFKENKFRLLVSTTVIEVGVDVPNANVMVIEHAERFGLAQLHQLRGRVGRGSEAAYCILLYHLPISDVGRQRLKLMKETTDGFLLSEQDLKLRGAGDILGRDQSGFDTLRFSDFSDNYHLVEAADEISDHMDLGSTQTADLCDIFKRVSDENIV